MDMTRQRPSSIREGAVDGAFENNKDIEVARQNANDCRVWI
mgnify:CR=1 FL=1